jgi:hypothetical protein
MKEEWKNARKKPCGYYRVDVRDKKERLDLIVFLEKNGFKCDESETVSRESTIASRFPITVDVGRKKYGHMGNTTCAAAAAASRITISAEVFYIRYEIESGVVIV